MKLERDEKMENNSLAIFLMWLKQHKKEANYDKAAGKKYNFSLILNQNLHIP